MTLFSRPPAFQQIPLRWRGWLMLLFACSMGALVLLLLNWQRVEQRFGPATLSHALLSNELLTLQRELLVVQVSVKSYRSQPMTPGFQPDSLPIGASLRQGYTRVQRSHERLRFLVEGVQSHDTFSSALNEAVQRLDQDIALTSRLVAQLGSSSLSRGQQLALLGALDSQIGTVSQRLHLLSSEHLASQRDLQSLFAESARNAQLLLLLVGLVTVLSSVMMLLQAQRHVQVEQGATLRFHLASMASRVAVYEWNLAHKSLTWSGGLTEAFGYPLGEVEPTIEWWSARVHPEERAAIIAQLDEDVAQARPFEAEYRFRGHDGSYHFVWDRGLPRLNSSGAVVGLVGGMMDITERKRSEQAVRESEMRYMQLVQEAPDAIVSLDRRGVMRSFNPAAERMAGRSAGAVVGRHFRALGLVPPEFLPKVLQEFELVLDGWERPPFELEIVRPDGGATISEAAPRAFHRNGQVAGVQFTLRDISERKRFEEQLAHQSFHDALTGLPNRALFFDRLERALVRTLRHPRALAVLFLDLDRFKVINDSLGHLSGDELLVQLAQRLGDCVREEDTIARLGGDEFIILLEEVEGVSEATLVAERIAAALRSPFVLQGRSVFVTASIGIVMNSSSHQRPDDLLRDADVAMYRAKARGKAQYELFDASMSTEARQRLELELELREALAQGSFQLFYQPLVSLDATNASAGRIVAVEALLRWHHPRRGFVPPMEIIALAEETGLIGALGYWILRAACRQVQGWRSRLPDAAQLCVNVNLSATQFHQPTLAQEVVATLQETGLPPGALRLEITESVMMADEEGVLEVLRQLNALGIRLAIDDFGVGYSALSYLKRFPLDTLKVDRSFISGLADDPGDRAIVLAVANLAHSLGLSVTAEGIESPQQLAIAREIGCNVGQGYYFARPLPATEMECLFTRAYSISQPSRLDP